MNARHPDFRPRFENDAGSELDELRLEVERLRDFIETRAQMQERLLRAMLDENHAHVAEKLEPRIQLATTEAIAFAEARLERQEATLRALGHRFAEFARMPPPDLPPQAPATKTLAYAIGPCDDDGLKAHALTLGEDSGEAWLRDAANLPIPPGGASRLLATHVIEHIAPSALETRVLPHWRSRLATGGELVVVTYDGPALLADLASRSDFALWRERLFAGGAKALRNLVDAPALVAALRGAGFAPDEPTRAGFAMRVVARG